MWDGIECIREMNRCHNQVLVPPLRTLEQLIQQYTTFAASVNPLDKTLLCLSVNSVLQVHRLESSCHQARVNPLDAIHSRNSPPVLQVFAISFLENENCSRFLPYIHHSTRSNFCLDDASHQFQPFWTSCFHDPVTDSVPPPDNISDVVFG
jgi:hypothetical protein